MLPLEKQNALRSRYKERHPDWQPATVVYEETIRRLLAPGMRVLDLGCGRGGVLEQLGEAVTYPIGLDPDFASLRAHRMLHLPRAVGLASALPFTTASFDLVVCSWVLEHIADPARAFSEIRRILKPGGRFVFLSPNAANTLATMIRLLRPLQEVLVRSLYARHEIDTFPPVYRANTHRTLTRLMANVGLQLEALYHIQDPTYLAFTPLLYHAAAWLSTRTPKGMRVHLVGVGKRPEESNT
jgi:ubiquinone/menaquinone biosynthesis C-methylase UbiE